MAGSCGGLVTWYVGIHLVVLGTPTDDQRCAGDEALHTGAGKFELCPDRCLTGWPLSGLHGGDLHGGDWRQGPALGARVRFKRSQGARRHARRDISLLVARQPLHRFLRRRLAQEDRGHRRAGTKTLRSAANYRRRLEPRRRDSLCAAYGAWAVAYICNGRRSHTGDNNRQVTPGDFSYIPNFSAGWSS